VMGPVGRLNILAKIVLEKRREEVGDEGTN
jgi:hypothetical protein